MPMSPKLIYFQSFSDDHAQSIYRYTISWQKHRRMKQVAMYTYYIYKHYLASANKDREGKNEKKRCCHKVCNFHRNCSYQYKYDYHDGLTVANVTLMICITHIWWWHPMCKRNAIFLFISFFYSLFLPPKTFLFPCDSNYCQSLARNLIYLWFIRASRENFGHSWCWNSCMILTELAISVIDAVVGFFLAFYQTICVS